MKNHELKTDCNKNAMHKPINFTPAILSRFIFIALGCFACFSGAQGVVPAPDGGYPNYNTAEGQRALLHLSSGAYNTAVGWGALESGTTANLNTGVGAAALALNTADENTAIGAGALLTNSSGGQNTGSGALALLSNTTGAGNSAFGDRALETNTIASFNTATGAFALASNTAAENTATGYCALCTNTTGARNTADGGAALSVNVTGNDNTATGYWALANNTGSGNTALGSNALINSTGDDNTAVGLSALAANTSGSSHTAVGFNALASNTSSGGLAANTAVGAEALANNTTGGDNVGIGLLTLVNNSTGSGNTAIGTGAGAQVTGDNNIDIGQAVAGVAGESNTTRIGNSNATTTFITGIFGATGFGGNPVYGDADGRLYTVASSKRFKENIKPMDKASEALLALKPVTFRYKKQIDPTGTKQFGLVAEEVEKVNPDLVVRDKHGKTYSVRYDQVNAMLLNEFLKEHRAVQDLSKEVVVLTATLKQQAAQIQTLAAQFEMTKLGSRTALNHN
jgi:hypothetical protein